MRAVVQRVSSARVEVGGKTVGQIGPGLLVLVGVGRDDEPSDANWLGDKIAGLRIFPDAQEKLNLSVLEAGGAVLAVSQFTLWGDCRKGRRPSFIHAAAGAEALPLFQAVVERLAGHGLTVATGEFGAMMDVQLTNQGPVTLLLDSKKSF